MRKFTLVLFASVVALAAASMMPAAAGAEPIFRYDIALGDYSAKYVSRLDTTKKTTVRVMHGGVENYRSDFPSGISSVSFSSVVVAGDVIQVYQGAAYPANPPVTPPTETFTAPAMTVTASAGSGAVSGTAEDGSTVRIRHIAPCNEADDSIVAARSPGAFSGTFPVSMQPHEQISALETQPDGDTVSVNTTLPGDAGCLWVDGSSSGSGVATPLYRLMTYGFDGAIATTRMVLRRGATVISDQNSASVYLTPDQKPLPGDVIDVYRPQGAASPSYSWTIPSVGGVFDAGPDLVAVDAPAASLVFSHVCRAVDCSAGSTRSQRPAAAGRTVFSFSSSVGGEFAHDILPDDQVSGDWTSPDGRFEYSFDIGPGDLTPPVGKVTFAKRLKIRKTGKRIGCKLNSSEPGTADAVLTAAGMPRAAAVKPVRLAGVKTAVKAGDNTLSLTLTKAGKTALKRLKKTRKSLKATLTVTLTDAAGNVSTIVGTTKLR